MKQIIIIIIIITRVSVEKPKTSSVSNITTNKTNNYPIY